MQAESSRHAQGVAASRRPTCRRGGAGELALYTVTDADATTRLRLLDEANRARERGRTARAIAIYRHFHESDPNDVEVAWRLGEVLAMEGESFEAWRLFLGAGRTLLRMKNHTRCLAVFREATRVLPYEFEAWRITAQLEQALGRDDEAQLTLLEGRRRFKTRFGRAQAIALLRLARHIEPWDSEIVIDLAIQYARSDQVSRALRLLDGLALHSRGPSLREVRWTQWQLSRSLVHLRQWFRLYVDHARARLRGATRLDSGLASRLRG